MLTLPYYVHRWIDHLPWILAGPLRKRFAAPIGHYFLLSKPPLIILMPEDFCDHPSLWDPFFDYLKNRRAYFLGLVRGGIEFDPPAYKQSLSSALAKQALKYPEHRFVFLANNVAQTHMYDELGIESAFVNHNCFANENLFTIKPNSPKLFDALYNGVCAPYKRLELASRTDNLAIITYLQSQHLDYFETTKALLGHAKWLNFPEGNINSYSYSPISSEGICNLLNQSRAGLCLSHTEGAMVASIEYLLAGLPVVSTPSYGGRDVFFDDEYVVTVEASAEAVRDGVNQVIGKNIDPYKIRTATLRKVEEHRQRFVDLIVNITEREGLEADRHRIYEMICQNQMYKLRSLHKIF